MDGGFESSCTAASYGPSYEAFETRCDGLDNDCSGVVDATAAVDLMQGAGGTASEVAWAQYDGGFLSVYAAVRGGKRSVFFRRFDTELRPMTAEIELSATGAQASRAPQLVRIGAQDAIALWVEDLPAAKRIVITKVDPDGRRFIAGTDGAVLPIAGPANVAGAPALAVSVDNQYILGAWVDSVSNSVQATVVSGDGTTPVQGVTAVVPATSPDGGTELSLEVRAVGGLISPFVLTWTSILNGVYHTSARTFGTNLQPLGTVVRFPTAANAVPLMPRGAQNSALTTGALAWVERNTVTGLNKIRAVPDVLNINAQQTVASVNEPVTALELAPTPRGFQAVWAHQTDAGTILTLRPLDAGVARNVYGPVATEIDALSLAPGNTGAITGAAFIADGGTQPDVLGFEYCAP